MKKIMGGLALILVAVYSNLGNYVSAEEWSPGSAARLKGDSSLRSEPNASSASQGKLPKGAILIVKGEEKNGFLPVAVELEDGMAEGWISISALEGDEDKEPAESTSGTPNKLRRLATDKSSRVVIPKDEGLLLRRDPSFLYGIALGPQYNILTPDNLDSYVGLGGSIAFYIGWYVDRSFPVQFELGYSIMGGKGPDSSELQLGYLEARAIASYLVARIVLMGGIQYSYGLSLSDLPSGITVDGASGLSATSVLAGFGYRFSWGELIRFQPSFTYSVSLFQGPIHLQKIFLSLSLGFNG